mmetsp:Transcript_4419/g.15361  ORF Transcript_4419/g.15361 Transcript_4419/m.15361 type:complete len:126 (+) Transcript_4419:33-410(+)
MPLSLVQKLDAAFIVPYAAGNLIAPAAITKQINPKLEGNKGVEKYARFCGVGLFTGVALNYVTKDADAATKRKVAAVSAASYAGYAYALSHVNQKEEGMAPALKAFNLASQVTLGVLHLKEALGK